MSKDKFSYYVDDDDNAVKMDHFTALKLDKDFFEEKKFDLDVLKKQYKKLAIEYHPDRNDGIIRAKISFQRIALAYECLSDPVKRKNYLSYGNNQFTFTFSEEFVYQDLEQFFNEKLDKIDELNERLEKLDAVNQGSEKTLNAVVNPDDHDSLEKIILDFAKEYRSTLITPELFNKQNELFHKIKDKIKTSAEYYAFHLIIDQDHVFSHQYKTYYLQKAAANNHLLAMSKVVSRALAGHFTPLEDSIRWALTTLRHLETTVIPHLEHSEASANVLSQLKDEIVGLRERRKEILPEHIPDDPKQFEDLVQKYLEYRFKRGGVTIDNFIVNASTSSNLAKEPNQLNMDSKLDLELFFLQSLLQDFSKKIALSEQENKASSKSIDIAKKLNADLFRAIHTYIQNKASNNLTKEQAKEIFVKTAAHHIKLAKPALEKELGWGDYLTNLLKSIANFFIQGANNITNLVRIGTYFSFFSYVKAPLYSEVEHIEVEINKKQTNSL